MKIMIYGMDEGNAMVKEKGTICVGVLERWARLGMQYREVGGDARWESVRSLIETTKQFLSAKREYFDKLLSESDKRFAGMRDPFRMDLGLHRWLRGEREERYSDWLDWVLRQLNDFENILFLFGLKNIGLPSSPERINIKPEIEREVFVGKGHVDAKGRIDLIIRLPETAVIAVEVKVVGGGDTVKNKGYVESIARMYPREKIKRFVFLTPDPEDNPNSTDENLDNRFELLTWREFCLNLRGIVSQSTLHTEAMVRAMILAFIGAVEQNVLGMKVPSLGNPAAFNSMLVDHIKCFLEVNSAVR